MGTVNPKVFGRAAWRVSFQALISRIHAGKGKGIFHEEARKTGGSKTSIGEKPDDHAAPSFLSTSDLRVSWLSNKIWFWSGSSRLGEQACFPPVICWCFSLAASVEVLMEEPGHAPPRICGGINTVYFRTRVVEEGVLGAGIDVHFARDAILLNR